MRIGRPKILEETGINDSNYPNMNFIEIMMIESFKLFLFFPFENNTSKGCQHSHNYATPAVWDDSCTLRFHA